MGKSFQFRTKGKQDGRGLPCHPALIFDIKSLANSLEIKRGTLHFTGSSTPVAGSNSSTLAAPKETELVQFPHDRYFMRGFGSSMEFGDNIIIAIHDLDPGFLVEGPVDPDSKDGIIGMEEIRSQHH